MKDIVIKSFNGIGDLLFLTPSLPVIKKAYPDLQVFINTNYPRLLSGNPYITKVNAVRGGLFLGYPDPIHAKEPTKHHIISDWEIICNAFHLVTEVPNLQPELYHNRPERGDMIRVQLLHKGQWYGKKVWPEFQQLARRKGFESIPPLPDVTDLIRVIAESKAVVCSEGAISHIAKAVGTPAVVIFGGFASPRWSGYEDHINITSVQSCSYCYNPNPCPNGFTCMRDITVDQVEESVSHLLRTCS